MTDVVFREQQLSLALVQRALRQPRSIAFLGDTEAAAGEGDGGPAIAVRMMAVLRANWPQEDARVQAGDLGASDRELDLSVKHNWRKSQVDGQAAAVELVSREKVAECSTGPACQGFTPDAGQGALGEFAG